MIEIYKKGNVNYKFNGDITLLPTSCEYDSILNGSKEVTLNHPFDDDNRWKYIDNDDVIAATIEGKKKLFRIYNVERNLDEVIAHARPLAYDLIDYMLLDVRPTLKTGQEALNIILNNTPFKGYSNLNDLNTAYYVRKNILESLSSDDENSFLNRWGGEILFDNYDIYINDKVGSDKGVTVEFGYNLESITEEVSYDGIVTRGIPVGYDGLMLEGDKPWIDSPIINKYPHPKMRTVDFPNVKVKSSPDDEEGFNTIEEARAELKRLMNEYYEKGLDKPSVSYTVSMIDIANTVEYEDYKILETVSEGDVVHIKVKKLGILLYTRVNHVNIDLITGKINSLELGTIDKNYFEEQADIKSRVDNIINPNGSVKANSLQGTINALQTQFKALKDIAQKQHVRAMLFEDLDKDSPTFGAMCIGTMGFEIASERTADNNDWDWRTFGTGKGFAADCIVAGTLTTVLLESVDGSCSINLSNGIINLTKGIIKGLNSSWDLDTGIFNSKGFNTSGEQIQIMLKNGGIYSDDYLEIQGKKGIILEKLYEGLSDLDFGNLYLFETGAYVGGKKVNLTSGSDGITLISDVGGRGRIDLKGETYINGTLATYGDKNCIQRTSMGDIKFYATEDINSYLTICPKDITYKCDKYSKEKDKYYTIINLKSFNNYMPNGLVEECINLNKDTYKVYIHKLAFGDYKVVKYDKYFIVFSDNENFEFEVTFKGERKNFENSDKVEQIKNYNDKLENRSYKKYINMKSKEASYEWQKYGECYEG